MVTRLLIVEDDPAIARLMARSLESASPNTISVIARTAAEGLHRFEQDAYDLILLDLGLPDRTGLDLLPDLRAIRPDVPIIMITGSAADSDVVAALNAGADDFIAKPVSDEVLSARVAAVLRRRTPVLLAEGDEEGGGAARQRELQLVIGDLTLDYSGRRASTPAGDLSLTPTELRLLGFLMRNVGKVVARPEILKEVWGYDFDPGTSILDVALARLRSKLSAATKDVRIDTLRAQGLVLRTDTRH